MKYLPVLALFVASLSQPLMAQNWSCDGETSRGSVVEAIFSARTNSAIANIIITEEGVVTSRLNPQQRADATFADRKWNRFKVNGPGKRMSLFLPLTLAEQDDEFVARIQIQSGTGKLEDVKLSCVGAG